jgi:CRISPR-associated protein Csh1
LLNYQNTKDGLVFNDFDFVTQFEYELKDQENEPWKIVGLFGKNEKHLIKNVFEFQNEIIQRVFNNQLIVKTKDGGWRQKYFDEIEEHYCKSSRNYLNILKFRKAIYDFVYKSKRQAITSTMFHEMMQVSICEDIRLDKYENKKHSEYFNIIEKLNIWFSLYEKFDHSQNNKYHTPMASKLKEYQQFVDSLALGNEHPESTTDEQFMFAAGQVIAYVLNQSESSDNSYKHLEPYLQKVSAEQLKGVIAHEIARYKHKIGNYRNSRFKPVSAFVLSYETSANLKKYLPELLAGLFANNQLYLEKNESKTEN